jgi:tetratricopeptide (TPR) repeat protein
MPHRFHFSLLLSTLLLAAGCGDDGLRRYDSAVLAAEDGRNTAALTDATYAARHLQGAERYRAFYVAGLAAMRLGRETEARKYLEKAIHSIDKEVSGKAYVELGFLDSRAKRPLSAAGCYEHAARRLGSPENGRAMLLAAECYTKAGRTSDARRCLAMASTRGDNNTSAKAASKLDVTGYTIQFGSYSSKENAQRRASEVSPIARTSGLGHVRVRQEDGEWKVQLGTFADRRRASQTLNRLGRTDAYVEELGG